MRNRSAHPMRVLGGLLVAAVTTQREHASSSRGLAEPVETARVARPLRLLRTLAGALSSPAMGMRVAARIDGGDAPLRARTTVLRAVTPSLILDSGPLSGLTAADVAASLGFTPEKATEIVRKVDQNSDGKVELRELRQAMKKVRAQPGFVDPFPAGPEGPEKDLILVFASEEMQRLQAAPAASAEDVEAADLKAAAALQDALSEKYRLVQGLKARQEKAEAVLKQAAAPESPSLSTFAEQLLPQQEREKRARLRSAAETEKIVASVEEVIEYMDKLQDKKGKKGIPQLSPAEMVANADAAKSAAAAAKAAADKATSEMAPAAEAAARAAESAKLAAEQITKAYETASDQAAKTAARASAKNAADQATQAAEEAIELATDEALAVAEAKAAEIVLGR